MRTDNFVFEKSPEAVLDFSINWSQLIGANAIDSSVWTLDSGPTILNTSISGIYTTIWISGGEPGTTYCGKNVIGSDDIVDSAIFSLYVH